MHLHVCTKYVLTSLYKKSSDEQGVISEEKRWEIVYMHVDNIASLGIA